MRPINDNSVHIRAQPVSDDEEYGLISLVPPHLRWGLRDELPQNISTADIHQWNVDYGNWINEMKQLQQAAAKNSEQLPQIINRKEHVV